jgi:hypothetical protein
MTDDARPEDTPGEEEAQQATPLPEPSFTMLAFLLSSQALAHLGQAPDGQPTEPNLDQAKFTIDLLGVLEEKTKGNLDEDEQAFLKRILFDLRMQYVEASKGRAG